MTELPDSITLVEEAQNILDEQLIDTLYNDYGIKMPNPEEYLEYAKEGVAEVWYPGSELWFLDSLSDIASTNFAEYVEEFSVPDYYAAGSSPNENVEIYEHKGETAEENFRRAISSVARSLPQNLIREAFLGMYGVDPLDTDERLH